MAPVPEPTPGALRRRSVALALLAAVGLTLLLTTPAGAQVPAPDGQRAFAPAQSPQPDEPDPADTPAVPGIDSRTEPGGEPTAPDDAVAPDEPTDPDPDGVSVSITSDDEGLSRSVLIVLLLTIGSVAPAILLLTTSFTRFAVVLGLTRSAIGTQQVPPTQVLVGLSLFLTFFVMAPVVTQINEDAVQPVLAGELDPGEAISAGYEPLRDFMLAQIDEQDLALFLRLSESDQPEDVDDLPASVVIPSFVLGELRAAFTIGFIIYIPFLVIDLVVASVLMSMGMVMLPPVFISLPMKLLLFVMVDGWGLIVGSLVSSVNGVGA